MKRIFLSLAVMMLTVVAFAQEKSVVGTWKIVRIQSPEIDIDLESKESMKNFATKMFGAQGQTPDSAMIEQFSEIMRQQFVNARMVFNANGECEYSMPSDNGETKTDKASYTVDYAKKMMYTTSKDSGKKEELEFNFEKDRLVIKEKGSSETLYLSRAVK